MANVFKRKVSQDVGTSIVDIGSYSAPSTTIVIGLTVANKSGSAITIEIDHYASSTQTFIVKGVSIPTGTTLIVIGGEHKIVLETGDKIRIKSSAVSSADVIMSVMET